MDNKNKRTTRVSTDEQADKGYSQRMQADILVKYCAIKDISVHKVVYEDYSAKNFECPEWKKLMVELRKQKGKVDYILFTKWDRFSRNVSLAYQMIDKLRSLSIEPQAIEQPLNMTVPENKLILAVYLTTPEIENDRRSLNVKDGMHQARKEGRWMGVAPPGYKNKVRENGQKYMAIDEPQASHMRWAFEKLAEGLLTTKDVWKMARTRGLKCSENSFWTAIRNVGHCGLVYVPKYKTEEAHYVKGQHAGLISETLFYKVQEVLDGRKRVTGLGSKRGIVMTSPDMLPLRGFLSCDRCPRVITGSATKGRNNHFYYYHCRSSCSWRERAEIVNKAFIKKLKEFVPKNGMAEVYEEVVKGLFGDATKNHQSEKKILLNEIRDANNRIIKARELLLDDGITADDYRTIKHQAEEKIIRLEAKMEELTTDNSEKIDIEGITHKAVENFKRLDLLYVNADTETKREIIGLIFSEKWHFQEGRHRTGNLTPAAEIMYLINNRLKTTTVRGKIKRSSRN